MNKQILDIAIVLASKNRPKELAQWKSILGRQSSKPKIVVYSVTSYDDMPQECDLYFPNLIIIGESGAAKQRNRGLEAVLGDSEFIAFFDDDYVLASNCVENICIFMRRNTDVAGVNGLVLLDGVGTEEIAYHNAVKLLDDAVLAHSSDFKPKCDLIGLYGCNMAFRTSAIGSIRFDEKLPLYSWQEDIDFAVQVGRSGRIVKSDAFMGVHQGVKSSRTSGVKFGYSQISNPIYLIQKGTMPTLFGINLMIKNFLSNHLRVFKPEKWIDRKGRVLGNWLALKDALQGKLHPMRILEIDP